MNILVTGANGQLGMELKDVLKFDNVTFATKQDLDITEPENIIKFCDGKNFDIIINCAAYTNVDKAESDVALTYEVNTAGPRYLSEYAFATDATLIHISSDYVFNGLANIPYDPDEYKGPMNNYGNTKYCGELEIINSHCKYIIIRTSWLYSSYGKNFVKSMINKYNDKNVKELKIVYDQVGSPTYAKDLAVFINHIISHNLLNNTGIYHFANHGVTSWYDFTCAIFNLLKSNKKEDIDTKVKPIMSEEYPTPARRPNYSVLDCSKTERVFKYEIPNWYESLKYCIEKIHNK